MDPTQLDLFTLAERRLAWINQRQSVLAQNVANASTPGFQPSDVRSFASTLNSMAPIAATVTQPGHIALTRPDTANAVQERNPHGPDGNGVSLDKELTRIADTETMQSLTSSIYKKYMTLFSMALGHSA
jgi:flagellar basal-body rod protein FlgB